MSKRHQLSWLGLTLAIALSACGESKRPCLEEAECFAGEYCAHSGYCAPYRGKVITTHRPGAQDPQITRPDQGNPFMPTPMLDLGPDLDQTLDQGDQDTD